MKISINPEVFKKYPKLSIAFILAKNIDNQKKLAESLELLEEAEELVRLTYNKDSLKSHQLIAPWRVAREEFGEKARHYHTSVEKLLGAVLAKKKIAANDVATNLAHYLALKHVVPYGLDDYKKIKEKLSIGISSKKERLGFLKNMEAGSLYYRDAEKVLSAKLDYWKNPKTALTPDSTSVLIHFEALPPLTSQKLNEIAKEATELINSFCEGKAQYFILNKNSRSRSG